MIFFLAFFNPCKIQPILDLGFWKKNNAIYQLVFYISLPELAIFKLLYNSTIVLFMPANSLKMEWTDQLNSKAARNVYHALEIWLIRKQADRVKMQFVCKIFERMKLYSTEAEIYPSQKKTAIKPQTLKGPHRSLPYNKLFNYEIGSCTIHPIANRTLLLLFF